MSALRARVARDIRQGIQDSRNARRGFYSRRAHVWREQSVAYIMGWISEGYHDTPRVTGKPRATRAQAKRYRLPTGKQHVELRAWIKRGKHAH